MKRIVLLAVVPAALAWTAQAPARTLCTPGVHKSGGATYRTFCGPAHATIKSRGKTYILRNGSCSASDKSTFSINIGTVTLGAAKPKYDYFGITVFATKDGTYTTGAVVAWERPGTRAALWHTTVKLQGGRTRGSFAGQLIIGGGTASGTFSCR